MPNYEALNTLVGQVNDMGIMYSVLITISTAQTLCSSSSFFVHALHHQRDGPLPVVLSPRRACAVESYRGHYAVTQIIRRRRVVDRIQNINALDLHPGTGTRSAALNLRYNITDRRAGPVPQDEVPDVELARFAVPCRGVVASALCERKDAGGVLQCKILQRDVGRVSETAAAAVGRVACAVARPSLDVGAVAHSVVDRDVTDGHVLNGLVSAIFRIVVS